MYFYQALAGIQPHPAARGLDQLLIKPRPVPALTFVNAYIVTVRGPVAVHWTLHGTRFDLHITIPPNMHAHVFLPGTEAFEMLVPEQRAIDAALQTGSGTYHFASRMSFG